MEGKRVQYYIIFFEVGEIFFRRTKIEIFQG